MHSVAFLKINFLHTTDAITDKQTDTQIRKNLYFISEFIQQEQTFKNRIYPTRTNNLKIIYHSNFKFSIH